MGRRPWETRRTEFRSRTPRRRLSAWPGRAMSSRPTEESRTIIMAFAIRGGSFNVVQGNYIGTDATGTVAKPNAGNGVSIEGGSPRNTIGGSGAGEANVMSGNQAKGIYDGGS